MPHQNKIASFLRAREEEFENKELGKVSSCMSDDCCQCDVKEDEIKAHIKETISGAFDELRREIGDMKNNDANREGYKWSFNNGYNQALQDILSLLTQDKIKK